MVETFFWFLLVAGGPVLLGVALFLGLMRRRRLTQSEQAAQSEAVDHLYARDRETSDARKG